MSNWPKAEVGFSLTSTHFLFTNHTISLFANSKYKPLIVINDLLLHLFAKPNFGACREHVHTLDIPARGKLRNGLHILMLRIKEKIGSPMVRTDTYQLSSFREVRKRQPPSSCSHSQAILPSFDLPKFTVSRKCENIRLLGPARIQKFPHEPCITYPGQWNTVLYLH
jgi:hypothetical protein